MESSEIYSTECRGLKQKYALRADTGEKIHISEAYKELTEYYCPECLGKANVRKGKFKTHHFGHFATTSSLAESKDTTFHTKCQNEIMESLKKQYPNGDWSIEKHMGFDSLKGENAVVADIHGYLGSKEENSRQIVIEVQRSKLNIKTIAHRTTEYLKRDIHILWVVPIMKELGVTFRPRSFEKYLHTMYLGRTYYWVAGYGSKVRPVHHDLAKREIPFASFYRDGEQQEHGGYSKAYYSIKEVNSPGLLEIGQDFSARDLKLYSTKYRNTELIGIPERKILLDNLKKWWDIDKVTKDVVEMITE